jgi:aminoglycoside phosphotransferase (APT) family kinase protein
MVYDLEKEAAVMRAYRAYTDVPAPEVVQVEPNTSVLGGPFLVTRAVEGWIPPDDPPYTAEGWVLDLAPERQARLHDNALHVLAKIHAADPRELGLDAIVPETGKADLLGHDIAYWRQAYEWSHGGVSVPVLDTAWDWIDANRPGPTTDLTVSWGDARFGNMIFDEDLEVRAVLDWEQMTLGPRELDLSWWTVVSYRHHGAAQGHTVPPGFPSYAAILERYAELTGYQPRDMHFYDVYSAVRLSILAVRAATMLIDAGVLPPDSPMAHNNPTTDIIIDLLDLPKPETAGDYYMGKRT